MALNIVTKLSNTGVIPGNYTNANLTVDEGGRIVSAVNGLTGAVPAGTITYFFQSAAPTGWTQIGSLNDITLRVVNGTGGGTGGAVPFSSVFSPSLAFNGSVTFVTGTVGDTTLSQAQLAYHSHIWSLVDSTGAGTGGNPDAQPTLPPAHGNWITSPAGGYDPHGHSIAGQVAGANFLANFALQYVDTILCSKN